MDLCKTLVEKYNFDIHRTDYSGKSSLHYCAENGSHELFHYLIKKEININQRTKNGQNCLHIAASRGYMDLCKTLVEKYNFAIHKTDYLGKSSLHYCAEDGSHQLFNYFIKKGIDINQRTKNGQNSLHIAASRNIYGSLQNTSREI